MRRVHWKRLLLVFVIVVLVAGSAYALNRTQVKRQAGVLRERAEKAEADAKTNPDKRAEAIDLYEQYLKFRPHDEQAALQYVRLILKPDELDYAKLEKMRDIATRFLREFPDHPEERRILVKVLFNKGDLNGAREHLAMLLKDPKLADDLDLLEDAIRIEEAGGRYAEGLVYLDRGIENGKDPARVVKFYGKSLSVLRFLHKDSEAALRLDILQKKAPYATRPDARLVVVRHLIATRDYPTAREHVAIARSLPGGANDPDVLLASAEVEVTGDTPQLEAARQYLERSFALDPKRVATGTLLAQVLIQQGNHDEAVKVLTKLTDAITTVKEDFFAALDKLIDLREVNVSEKMMTRMNEENSRKFVIQYFRGRLELVKNNWPQAMRELEAAAPFLSGLPEFHKKLRCDLGKCYSLAQNPDQMLISYKLAYKDDRFYFPAQLGLAEAYVKLGQFRDAIPIYKELAPRVKSLQPTLARLVLLEQMSLPESIRNWRAFDEALGPPPYSTELLLLKAEALNLRKEKELARQALEEAKKKDPTNPTVRVKEFKIASSDRKISSEEANRLIEDARKETGDSVDLRLATANILMSRAKKPTLEELQGLGTVPAGTTFQKPDLYRLWFGLGDLANRQTDMSMKQAALDFFRRAAEADPLDLVVRAVIVDLALTLNLEPVWEKALREIGEIDGAEGPIYNLGRIAIRLKNYTPGDKETLRDLRKRAEGIQKKRPAWPRAYLALAQIDELEGLNDSALQNLQTAIKLGDKQEAVIRKVVDHFRERKMYDDAAVLLNKMHNEVVLPDDLQRFRAIMNLLTSDTLSQDVREIDQFAPADAPTYELQLLRGTLLAALREDAGAEKAFRTALEKVPTERPGAAPLEAWSSLVVLLVRTEKLDIARRAVDEAERKLHTTPPKVPNLITLAGINEAIRDYPSAEKFFQEIVTTAPNDLDGHKQLVMFLQRTGRGPDAEAMLRTLITNPSQGIARWARRHLAISLMMKREAYQEREYALRLVEQNLQHSKDDIEDRKAFAIVLCVDPSRRAEGMRILAEYGQTFELTPDEYYLLTRLYFDQGRFDDARQTLKFAIRHRPNINTEHLAGAVSLYLAMDEINLAQETMARLKAIAPKSWEACREEARVLFKTGNTAEARNLILKHPYALTEAFIPTRTGPLLDEIKCYPDVEQLYTKYLETSKSEGAHLPLASFYIAQKQTDKAIDLAQKYADRTHVLITGRILSSAVRAKMPAPDKVALVETWLNKKLAENQVNASFFASLTADLAQVRDAQGRFDEAIAEYEKARRLEESDLVVNNMAMLLALHRPGSANEAKKMMDHLIGVRGPASTFLDTRAVCSLVQGENAPAEAVKDLKLALAQSQKAVYYFHLAWAYDLMRREQDKNVALLKATQLGLTVDDLHPRELPKYRELYRR